MARLTSYLLRIGAVLLLMAIAFAGWSYWRKASDTPLEERYRVEEVDYGDLTQTVTANGALNPVVLVNVGTQVSGTVKKLYADFNSQVKAGQILLELDPTTFRAAVEQSSGNVANAEASLKLARANEQRMRELFALEYVSRQDLDQALQAREGAQAQLQTARGQLQRDRANLNYSIIRSPVSGVVVSRQVNLGQTVAASFQTPTLFQIAQDLTQMQIDTNVAEADIGKIQLGQTARFTVDAFSGQRFEGKVRQIRLNPINQQNVITYDVVVGGGQSGAQADARNDGLRKFHHSRAQQRSAGAQRSAAVQAFRRQRGRKEARVKRERQQGKPRSPAVYVIRGNQLAQ